MKLKDKLSKLSNYAILGSFLAIEVFAFVMFSFGSSFLFFGILSFALLIILCLLSVKELKVDGFMSSMILIFPLLLFVLLTALSNYSVGHAKLGDFSIAEIVFLPIGLLSAGLCGTLLSKNKTFKFSTFILVIFSALALLVFINLLINMINFGWFYSIKYKGYYMYYGGKRSDVEVSQIAYTLEGFQFIETKMSHYAMYPALLLSSAVVLFNSKYIENKPKFLTYLGFVVLGVLSLVLVPSIIGAIFAVVIIITDALILLFNKFKVNMKPFKVILYCGLICAVLVVAVMILNNNVESVAKIISKNSFLNRIFNTNRFVENYNVALKGIFTRDRFFGFFVERITTIDVIELHATSSGFFDSFMTSGVIGTVMLVVLFYFGFKGFTKNKYLSPKEKSYNNALLAFIILFAFMLLFFYDTEYGIFHQVYRPFYMTGPFMTVVFIMFYINSKGQLSNGGRL